MYQLWVAYTQHDLSGLDLIAQDDNKQRLILDATNRLANSSIIYYEIRMERP